MSWHGISKLLITVIAWLGLLCSEEIRAQKEPPRIEDQIPESLADDEDVLVMADRLKNLRLSESRLGDAHPAMKSIRVQIKKLERELRDRIEEGGDDPSADPGTNSLDSQPRNRADRIKEAGTPSVPRMQNDDKRFGPGNASRGKGMESARDSSKWSDDLRSKWGARINQLDLQSSTPFVWREAFPQLRWQRLHRVGAFPAMGALWGMETVGESQSSCLWRWQDHEMARQKFVVLELPGRMHDLEFDTDFEANGYAYVVATGDRSSDGISSVDVWRYTFSTTPPFRLESNSALRLASGTTQIAEGLDLRRGNDREWLLELGESSSFQCQIPGCRAFETRPGVWKWRIDSGGEKIPQVAGETKPLSDALANTEPKTEAASGVGTGSELDRKPEESRAKPIPAPVWKVVFTADQIELIDLEGGQANRALPNPYGIEEVLGISVERTALPDQIAITAIDRRGGRAIEIFGNATNLGTRVSTLTSRNMTAMGVDSNGQLLAIEAGRMPMRLTRPLKLDNAVGMPTRLSQSGWYRSLADRTLEPGFVKLYEADGVEGHGAHHEVWCCLPIGGRIEYDSFGPWRYPDGTVIVQTLFDANRTEDLSAGGRGQPPSYVATQTRVFVHKDGQWYPYAYQWEDDGLDAVLVGEDNDLFVVREQAKCNQCHVGQGDSYLLGVSKRINEKVQGKPGSTDLFDLLVSHGMLRNRKVEPGAKAPYKDPGLDYSSRFEIEGRNRSLAPEKAPVLQWFQGRMQSDLLEAWMKRSVTEGGRILGPLDADWQPVDEERSSVAYQAGVVYSLACGHEVARDDRYLSAAIASGEYLIRFGKDAVNGGFYESLDAAGNPINKRKLLSTNAMVMLALAKLSQVSGRRDFLDAAVQNWSVLRIRMEHPVGGYYAEGSQDFQSLRGCSTLALLDLAESLWGMVSASRSTQIAEDADRLMDFVFSRLVLSNEFIPRDFEEDWKAPLVKDQAPEVELADQLRWAFLASEAVRLGGGSSASLKRAFRLLDFAENHGLEDSKRGLGSYENRWKKGVWQQAEFLRTLTRFACAHDREGAWEILPKVQRFVAEECIDSIRGGWVAKNGGESNVRLAPTHEAGMYLEGMRWQMQLQSGSKPAIELEKDPKLEASLEDADRGR
ncbi:MAG: AGE family epimerase/isomerase [Pirellula sp.]